MKWSDRQQEAIETRNRNILVAAAAGSGKTAVLVERIIRKILSGECDIDKILVVTFTNAAAAEMRARVESALHQVMEKNPSSDRAGRQLALLSNASISTLHSFCQRLIRENFQEIDLDPKFRLAGEDEIRLLRQDVLAELFTEKYEEAAADFLSLADKYGTEHGDEALYGIVQQLYSYAQSQPFPCQWLEDLSQSFRDSVTSGLQNTVWLSILQKHISSVVSDCAAECAQLLAKAEEFACGFYVPALQEDEQIVQTLCDVMAEKEWDAWREAFYAVKFPVMRAPRGTDEEIKACFSKPRDKMKKKIKSIQETYFQADENKLINDIKETVPDVDTMCSLAIAFAQSFSAAKKERQILDFNDLEHFALNILAQDGSTGKKLLPSLTAVALQERFQEIMVDEYQDTNGVQEAILSLLVSDDKHDLFAVGDVKQSIYRFRLADPSLFLSKAECYPARPQEAALINLSQNFRSRESVLAAINFLFQQLMVSDTMELSYGEEEALYLGMAYPSGAVSPFDDKVEVDIIDQSDCANGTAEAEEQEELAGFSLEAAHIAARLHAVMDSGMQVFDKAEQSYRPINWRDMVVLLRSVKGKAEIIGEELRKVDIPAYSSVDSGYFAETEIKVMLSLLSVIDNARQDIPLAAVLLSPIGEFSAADLAELHLIAVGEDLFTAILAANDPDVSLTHSLQEKTAAFLKQLSLWRKLAGRVSVPDLIWQIYRDTGYYEYVGGMPGGQLRQANLRMLARRAADYEKTNYRGLFRFLRFVEKMKAMDTDLASAHTLGENEDVVRIMSIHKSKGLEFPLVVLADCGKKFNLADTMADILLHRQAGIGPYHVSLANSVRYPTIARQAVAALILQESKAEELRVLYVALTRAREKLILVGRVKDASAKALSWSRFMDWPSHSLPGYASAGAESYLDWLGMALSRHKDGAMLRQMAGLGEKIPYLPYSEKSHWQVSLIPASAINSFDRAARKITEGMETVRALQPLPHSEKNMAEHVLSWRYDMQGMEGIPSKLSVSELKRRFAIYDEEDNSQLLPTPRTFNEPLFIKGKKSQAGTEYGTLLHTIMQHIDIHGGLAAEGLKEQLQRLVSQEIIMPEQSEQVQVQSIARFFASSLGQRMIKAAKIWREIPFSRILPADRFYRESNAKAEIFSQGIIDVLFQEADGQLVLLDYKTDRQTDKNKILQRYGLQMGLYREAIESIMQIQVTETYLCLLHNGAILKVPKSF